MRVRFARILTMFSTTIALCLGGCAPTYKDILQTLKDSPPDGGYLIIPTYLSDYDRDGTRQIGALYYVERGGKLSDSNQNLHVLCAVLEEYGAGPTTTHNEFAPLSGNTKIGGDIDIPILKKLLTGIDMSASHEVSITSLDLVYETLPQSALDDLEDRFKTQKKCQNDISNMKRRHPKSAASIFQLQGIAYTTISGKITNVASVKGGVAGTDVAQVGSQSDVPFDSKKPVVFKVYKSVD